MGIVATFAVSSAAILFALGIAVMTWSLVQLRSILYDEAQRRVEAQALNWIEANTGQLLFTANPAVLSRLLSDLTAREGLAYARIESMDGSALAEVGVPAELRRESSDALAVSETSRVYAMRAGDGVRYLELRTVVSAAGTGMSRDLSSMFAIASSGRSLATLRVGLDTRELETRLHTLLWGNAPLYAGLVLLAIAVQVVLTRRLVRPIAAIGQAARSVATDDLSTRVSAGSRLENEVGELVRNFNEMAAKLEQNRSEMRTLNVGLEQKVRDRTAELEALNARLQEMDRLKSEFLSTVSHEFRTPLTSIKAFAEILLDAPPSDRQQQQHFLGIINSESDRLTRLLSDLLDLAKIESGFMEWRFAELDLRDVVKATIAVMQPAAQAGNIRLELSAPVPCAVRADSDRIQQVVNNLLSNALKFSPEGGRVDVCITCSGPRARVSVSDDGPGISEADLPRIFQRFFRGSNASRSVKGTGLGLAISREIVLHHSGEIWAESQPGRGSVFCFTLPLAAANGANGAGA